MPPQAQNPAPSNGLVVAVGNAQTEIEVGFRVLVVTKQWDEDKLWYWKEGDSHLAFFQDDECVAFMANDGEVFPRAGRVIVKPIWTPSGPVQHGNLVTIDRVFASPPPQTGIVLRTGEGVSLVSRGQTVVLPRTGGNELGVRDRVLYSLLETELLGVMLNAVQDNPVQRDSSRGKAT